jgi:hypothetical protein
MGQFIDFENLATPAGSGSEDIKVYGVLALIDIVPVASTSFTITISRILPDGTLRTVYTATGVTSARTIERADMEQQSLELAGAVRVALTSAGNHPTTAAHVYLTVL